MYIFEQNIYPIKLIFPYLSVLLAALTVAFFLFHRNRLSKFKLVGFYLIYSILTDILISPASLLFFNNEFWGARLFTIIEFILISKFIYDNTQFKSKKLIFIIFSILFAAFFLIEMSLMNQSNFDSLTTGFSSLVLIIFSMIFLYGKITQSHQEFEIDGVFLLISSLIIYFSGTFFIYIYSSNYFNKPEFKELYNFINSIILITRNLIIITAFLRFSKYELKTSFIKDKYQYQ